MLLQNLSGKLLALPRAAKRFLAVMVDAGLGFTTVWLSFCLVAQRWTPLGEGVLRATGLALVLMLPVFTRLGLYRAIFRFSGSSAQARVALAVCVYGLLFLACLVVLRPTQIPVALGVVQPLLTLVAAMGARSMAHMLLGERYLRKVGKDELPRIVIYGAGSAGRQLAAGLRRDPQSRLIAYIDDDPSLNGHSINGCKVFHPSQMNVLVEKHDVTDVLLAIPSVEPQRRIEILATLRRYPVHVRTLPSLSDLATGRVELSDVRELDVEDLLGREPVEPDVSLLKKYVHGRVVVVTGAGGSIGSELCRQIIRLNPRKLLLVELSEFALYQIHQELAATLQESSELTSVELIPLLASVQNIDRMSAIMATWRPHIVYHAAAYKHVPLVEHNPAEGLNNNVWGTWTCARAALEHGVGNFVLVSTDKAVRPTNIMGASKRLAEMVLQALDKEYRQSGSGATTFSMVRFGNVLGSSGSVVPLFREQIKKGGPITLTHLDITRFFMTIPEAAQLVIQAGAMGTGGDVFVLDMGQPVRIADLARRMIELSGLSLKDAEHPEGDIAIEVTGLRPGEKLFEELLIGDNPAPTEHPRIMKAREEFRAWPELLTALNQFGDVIQRNDVTEIHTYLRDLVVGFQPSSDVVDWVYLARTTAH